MMAAVRLGARLAGAGIAAGAGRLRSALVALAAAIGTALMLAVLAIARSEMAATGEPFAFDQGIPQLLAMIVVTIALPVLVLAGTAGRLAAALRDRRLANLRLLGMTPGQTRLVAAVESGLAAAAGALVGCVLWTALRPALAEWRPADRPWSYATLTPTLVGFLAVVVAVPLAVTIVAASARAGKGSTMGIARRANSRRPSWWTLLPLAIGIAAAIYTVSGAHTDETDADLIPWMFVAIIALGLGVVLVVPSLVRLVADLLVHRRRRPILVLAGRRLQAQPAAASRVVAGLLIGLFIVTGARAVVTAFEQTPQYRTAATIDTTGQTATLDLDSATSAARAVTALGRADWVKAAATFPVLARTCSDNDPECWPMTALTGTCSDLARLFGPVPTCRDDSAAWISGPVAASRIGSLTFAASPREESDDPDAASSSRQGPTVTVKAPTATLPDAVEDGTAGQVSVFLPLGLPGLAAVTAHARTDALVVAKPGVDINASITSTDPSAWSDTGLSFMAPDMSAYRMAAGMRLLVWAVAAVVLTIGLLGFAIGAVDRAISRRAELISLQLIGTSARVLRRTQWIEAALPLVAGIVLAIGTGALAGAAYLAYAGQAQYLPWSEFGALAAAALAAAVVVAGFTVIASSPRIRPELIRTE